MQKLMYKGNGDQEKVSWLVYEFLILFYSYQPISYKLVRRNLFCINVLYVFITQVQDNLVNWLIKHMPMIPES